MCTLIHILLLLVGSMFFASIQFDRVWSGFMWFELIPSDSLLSDPFRSSAEVFHSIPLQSVDSIRFVRNAFGSATDNCICYPCNYTQKIGHAMGDLRSAKPVVERTFLGNGDTQSGVHEKPPFWYKMTSAPPVHSHDLLWESHNPNNACFKAHRIGQCCALCSGKQWLWKNIYATHSFI